MVETFAWVTAFLFVVMVFIFAFINVLMVFLFRVMVFIIIIINAMLEFLYEFIVVINENGVFIFTSAIFIIIMTFVSFASMSSELLYINFRFSTSFKYFTFKMDYLVVLFQIMVY